MEWIPTADLNKIRKTKSLPDATLKPIKRQDKQCEIITKGCDDETAKTKTKKKKKKSKLQRKATAVSNANVFITRKVKD